MNKVHYSIFSFFLVFQQVVFAQPVTVEIEKEVYKMDEEIKLTYQAATAIDSFASVSFANFEVLEGPAQSRSSSTINGVTKDYFSMTVKIKANIAGVLKIVSPLFYHNGAVLKADDVTILVLDRELSERERKEMAYKKFIEEYNKPEGTLRYVVKDDWGYIEEYKNYNWYFVRRLTPKELKGFQKN